VSVKREADGEPEVDNVPDSGKLSSVRRSARQRSRKA
jgi:hypothetical protein